MNRGAAYGTAVVVGHLVVTVFHGVAHRALNIGLGRAGMAFVGSAVVIGPLVAMALLWTSRRRVGLVLLSASMAGSLLFGLYNHFLVMGPDNVRSVPHEASGIMFMTTAILLEVMEAIGAFVGIYFFSRRK